MPKLDEPDRADEERDSEKRGHSNERHETVNARKVFRWESFARKKYAFGFDKLARKDIPSMSEKAHGVAACFRKIQGWKIPNSIFEDLRSGQYDVSVQLSMSLHHLKSMTFFGNTWIGTPLSLRGNETHDVIDIDYPEIVYLISRIIDPSCVGIIEIIVTKSSKDKQVTSTQYGCGWAIVALFDIQLHRSLGDASDGDTGSPELVANFYRGTPRDILEQPVFSAADFSKFKELSGCSLHFKLYQHRKLLHLSDILVENSVMGRYDVLPGLIETEVTLPNATRPTMLACIGGEDILDPSKGYPIRPANPNLAKPFLFKISRWRANILERSSFEATLRSNIIAGIHSRDSSKVQILSRIAKIGVHNGYTIVGRQWQEYPLREDLKDPDSLILHFDSTDISGYIWHELMSLVLVVDYIIGTPMQSSQHNLKAVQESSIPDALDDHITVTVGAFMFIPFEYDGSICLRENFRGSSYDIELSCKSKDICKILSPNKVFLLSEDDQHYLPTVAFDVSLYDLNGNEIRHGESMTTSCEDTLSVASDLVDCRPVKHSPARIRPATTGRPSSDSDSDSISESIVQGDNLSSSLRLNEKYYSSSKKDISVVETTVNNGDTPPRNSSPLLQRAMSVNLQKGGQNNDLFAPRRQDVAYKQITHLPIVSKELSRGARSRLSRHGFHTGVDHTSTIPILDTVDVDREAKDILSLNDISIQFAGFRYAPIEDGFKKPRAIYLSYQFYTCPFTRTEILRVLQPADDGEVGVLVRDGPHVRSEPSLSIHHVIDCSQVSPLEKYNFAEYLGRKMLYVDVWDADSKMLLGTTAVPLRRLMRQGQTAVKCAIECDVVDWDSSVDNGIGISSMNVVINGPLVGRMFGSLNIIMSNSGRQGLKNARVAESKDHVDEGLNWRIHDVINKRESLNRPRNSVRAKPLSECEPKLSKALYDRRARSDNKVRPSQRSLFDKRGNETDNTVTYDELVRLFKRFQGPIKGTVQYTGPLLRLLEVPSLESATSKLVTVLSHSKKIGLNYKSEISRFSDSRSYIGFKGLQEFLHRLSSAVESPLKRSDILVLTNSFLNNATELHTSEVLARFSDEVGRFEWVSISKRFKNAVQQATLAGINLNNLFSDVDRKNTRTISVQDLHVVLQSLAPFGKFSVSEIDVIAKYCSSGENSMVSIKSIMSLVNAEYTASNRSHLVEFLCTNLHKNLDDAFIDVISKSNLDPHKDLLDIEVIEGLLSKLGVLNHFSRSQVRSLVADTMNGRITLTGDEFLMNLKTLSAASRDHSDSVDLESLLRTLLSKAIDRGVDIVSTFRHFDCDGNGSISKKELESGISKLGISSSISNWKSQLPGFISRFDSSGDGNVSLKEFFSFFGIKDYTPNVIQKMTKIFAVANEKGMSVDDIFHELDTSSCGSITPSELQLGLKKYGIQSDISLDDCALIVSQFNGNGDTKISRHDFVTFFENRIRQVYEEKRRSKTDNLIQRFCSLMKLSIEKGLTLDSIFQHFDVSGDGNLSKSEFSNALRSIPHFSSLDSDDLNDLFGSIDHDADGHISIEELKKIVIPTSEKKKVTETTSVPSDDSNSQSIRSRFCKEMCRIAEPDGGLVGLLAYLDRDEDGLISCESFYRLLSREGVYDVVDKSSCASILSPLISNENINAALLLRFAEDSDFDPERDSLIAKDKLKIQIELNEVNDYEFSTNPEIRQVEKKLRGVGRILSSSGLDVESLFKKYDARNSGMIRKSDFIDILSKSGLYILEKGNSVEVEASDTISDKQKLQVQKLKDSPGRFQTRLRHTSTSYTADSKSLEEFEDHTESISLINWYRQGQKRLLLQRILSHSLAISVNIFPSFGQTTFFEVPVRNPFEQEEFFTIVIEDLELRLVTSFNEWVHLRHSVRSNTSLGDEPVDPELFDKGSNGDVHFALLPHETLHIPFTFLTLEAYDPSKLSGHLDNGAKGFEKEPLRVVEVRIISGSFGHVVSVVKVNVFPRPPSVNRSLHFFDAENTTVKKRLELTGLKSVESLSSRYIHCVEIGSTNRVMVDFDHKSDDLQHGEVFLRYKVPEYPEVFSFYLLIYSDPYHAKLDEVWLVIVHSRLKMDTHAAVGTSTDVDIVVRGDKFGRRVQAFASSPQLLTFQPSHVMQLTAGVYNRILARYVPRNIGTKRVYVNLVDIDTKELVSSWIFTTTATSPFVSREYDVNLRGSVTSYKKISFKNPWTTPRKFSLSSSDDKVLCLRDDKYLEVEGQGTAVIRLAFQNKQNNTGAYPVYLFLNDSLGNGEECFKFNICYIE